MVAPRQSLDSFLSDLLAEQGRLQTPVVQASRAHDLAANSRNAETNFHGLIPLSAPSPGEQYAFEVDLDACSGCKACVAACHALNGLEDTESWRDVGHVSGGTAAAPFQQTITTACHHCADPGCLNGCPVLAYEKDPVTGIVRHLDDQCIGCQYCVLKCPYDVPKYSERLGIVRKCDMCHQRLGAGEAPACVQACPTEAIKIVTVSIHTGRTFAARVDTSAFLAVAPDPAYTQPTTRYVSAQPLPANLVAADATALTPQPPHWPLVVMLTFMPMAVGGFTLATILHFTTPSFVTYYITSVAWLAGVTGLAASVFHLGQPWRAWRIFLGWRKSWLSREAMMFGAWFGLATATALTAAKLLPALAPLPVLLAATSVVGLLSLVCSAMIYVDTQRRFWRWSRTGPRFFGSAAVLGLAAAVLVAPTRASLSLALMAATLLKLGIEALALTPLTRRAAHASIEPDYKTARLLLGTHLRSATIIRLGAAFLGGILFPLIVMSHPAALLAGLIMAFSLIGELAERYLYFRAVVAPKMPGVVRA